MSEYNPKPIYGVIGTNEPCTPTAADTRSPIDGQPIVYQRCKKHRNWLYVGLDIEGRKIEGCLLCIADKFNETVNENSALGVENERLRGFAEEVEHSAHKFAMPEVDDSKAVEAQRVLWRLGQDVWQLLPEIKAFREKHSQSSTSAGTGAGAEGESRQGARIHDSQSALKPDPEARAGDTSKCRWCEHSSHDDPCNYLRRNGCPCEGYFAKEMKGEVGPYPKRETEERGA